MKRLYAAARRRVEHERCDLCAIPIGAEHDHLYAPATRALVCACLACTLIIPTRDDTPYRLIPRGTRRIEVADIGGWLDKLGVPVGVAALVVRESRITINYPGPAGLVEAELATDLWDELRAAVPAVSSLTPEVEALVWTRLGTEQVLRVGIDAVFRLIGELRRSWQGITGGLEGPAAVRRVMAELGAHA